MVIRYLLNKEIDFVKYDICISKALNTRVYAYSWYLNCVSDNWDVLIFGDYEVVMPLPVRKKYGINYIYQVPWIQQLGVFSKDKLDKNTIEKFITTIPNKFLLIDYFFNSSNMIVNKYIEKRTNYILQLHMNYENIRDNYNNNRKRIINKGFSDFTLDKKGNIKVYLDFYKSQNFNFKTNKNSIDKLEGLLNLNNESVNIWTVYQNNNLIAGLVWLKDKHRITYLAPIANEIAKKNNIPTYIVNELIKEPQNTNCILDFEGSMIDGVAQFYKSFGAEKETYYWYKKRVI